MLSIDRIYMSAIVKESIDPMKGRTSDAVVMEITGQLWGTLYDALLKCSEMTSIMSTVL